MRTLLLAAAMLAVSLSGCTEEGTGSASIYVKDAPTDDFAEIHVAFTMVEVHVSGQDENATSSWVTLWQNETARDIDLMNATGDRAAFLGEADLDAGHYTQIRIHATEAYGIDHEGARVNFTLANTPLKVVKSFDVEAGKETRLVVDYDLDRSVKVQGNGDYRMTPVIGKTTATVVEDAESGEDVATEGEIQEVTVEE